MGSKPLSGAYVQRGLPNILIYIAGFASLQLQTEVKIGETVPRAYRWNRVHIAGMFLARYSAQAPRNIPRGLSRSGLRLIISLT